MEKVIVITPSELQELIEACLIKVLAKEVQKPRDEFPEIMSLDQACKFLNRSRSTIYAYTSRRIIPFLKRGKILNFRRSKLEAWLNEGQQLTRSEILLADTLSIRNKDNIKNQQGNREIKTFKS